MSDLRNYWTARGVIPRWQYLTVYVAITAVFIGGLAKSNQLSHKAQNLAEQIQRQRVSVVGTSCQEQNARHDATITQLDQLIRKVPASRRQRARESRAGTVLLIDALVPKRDCAEVLRKATGVQASVK
jgi:hypothetical protein